LLQNNRLNIIAFLLIVLVEESGKISPLMRGRVLAWKPTYLDQFCLTCLSTLLLVNFIPTYIPNSNFTPIILLISLREIHLIFLTLI